MAQTNDSMIRMASSEASNNQYPVVRRVIGWLMFCKFLKLFELNDVYPNQSPDNMLKHASLFSIGIGIGNDILRELHMDQVNIKQHIDVSTGDIEAEVENLKTHLEMFHSEMSAEESDKILNLAFKK